MVLEIEKKFLLRSGSWKTESDGGVLYTQGYLAMTPDCIIRVRLEGKRAKLGIKKKISAMVRKEFEYDIPVDDARDLLASCTTHPPVEKIRYTIPYKGHTWEIDEFKGSNEGLVIAEVELTREEEPFERPDWLGDEVTEDERYLNVNLCLKPFKTWGA